MSSLDIKTNLLEAVDLIPTDLNAAHKIAQAHEGDPIADSIHAIIHRREGDYNNSIYWWRRVRSSVDPRLADAYPDSSPEGFVYDMLSGGVPTDMRERAESGELDALRSILGAEKRTAE